MLDDTLLGRLVCTYSYHFPMFACKLLVGPNIDIQAVRARITTSLVRRYLCLAKVKRATCWACIYDLHSDDPGTDPTNTATSVAPGICDFVTGTTFVMAACWTKVARDGWLTLASWKMSMYQYSQLIDRKEITAFVLGWSKKSKAGLHTKGLGQFCPHTRLQKYLG